MSVNLRLWSGRATSVVAAITLSATGAGIGVARSSPEAVLHVESVATRFLNVVGRHQSVDDRCGEMLALLESSVDIDGIVRDAAHKFWSTFSVRQQGELREALVAYVAADVSSVLRSHRGEALRVIGSVEGGGVTIVNASLDLKDFWERSLPMSWTVASFDGQQRIVDIAIGGASFKTSQRDILDTLFEMTNGDVDVVISSLVAGVETFPSCAKELESPS